MKALVVQALSPDLSGLSLIDVPLPVRRPGEVLVRINAASLNFPDLLMTRGDYQFRPPLPFISGLEFAGEVVASDGTFAPGMRVYGGQKTGAFAQYASVPASALSPAPAALSDAQAAALGAAYSTAYTALVEIGGLKQGQWVLIHGASGGVGLAACSLARALGAKVIAATGSPTKVAALSAACQPQAVIVAEGRFRDAVAEITGGRLCDLVYDPVGGDVFDESTRCVAFGGRLLVIGFAGGRIAKISTNIPLIKGFAVVGVRAGEYARRFPERGVAIRSAVAELAERGALTPRIDRAVPLSKWREAFAAMEQRKIVGKVVLLPNS